MPVAVRRRRLQVRQWCSLMGLMKPSSPRNPGKRKVRAGPAAASRINGSNGPRTANRRRTSAMDRKWRCHQVWEVVGISSMNRTCKGCSRASRAISKTSSSLMPRSTTQLIFRGWNPSEAAVSRPAKTLPKLSLPVILPVPLPPQGIQADVEMAKARVIESRG